MDQSDRLLDFLQTGKIALHGFEQLCRLRRRLQTPAAELEQLQLGGRLDLTEQPADRRLRGVQHFRGGDRRAGQHDRAKGLDLAKVERSRHGSLSVPTQYEQRLASCLPYGVDAGEALLGVGGLLIQRMRANCFPGLSNRCGIALGN